MSRELLIAIIAGGGVYLLTQRAIPGAPQGPVYEPQIEPSELDTSGYVDTFKNYLRDLLK